ncbi:hypothetical protein EJ04DRAFT_514459 [Polyplosphaeria fusca]|uniref:Uncharacterized protein n=1 Tax=Polyplosphaeria fusca TaxID=682080 RepID=A0A9P4QUK1_9PLEO|nr:hypothetical protein EJ04DRAFT_514459 [Polyplosphaeria fusca]
MARVQHPLRLIFADVDNVPEFLSYIGDYSKPRQQRIWWQDEGFEMYVDRLRHALSLEYKA